jgi:hypothetical protein
MARAARGDPRRHPGHGEGGLEVNASGSLACRVVWLQVGGALTPPGSHPTFGRGCSVSSSPHTPVGPGGMSHPRVFYCANMPPDRALGFQGVSRLALSYATSAMGSGGPHAPSEPCSISPDFAGPALPDSSSTMPSVAPRAALRSGNSRQGPAKYSSRQPGGIAIGGEAATESPRSLNPGADRCSPR